MTPSLTSSSELQSPKPQASAPRLRGLKFLSLLLFCAIVGTLSTGLWIASVQFPQFQERILSPSTLLGGILCVGLTTANLLLRWFRWHFLIRRFTPQLVTRDSLAAYFATLPAIMSPFFLAELGRVFLIRRRFRTPASYLVRVWFAERLLDTCVLFTAWWIARSADFAWLGGLGILLMGTGLFFLVLRSSVRGEGLTTAGFSLLVTVIAWTLPVVGLAGVLAFLGAPITSFEAAHIFAEGTLFGGLSGVPLGVLVVGSSMIDGLLDAGVARTTGVLAILVYRTGTAWFAVLLGLLCLVVFRKRLLRMVRGEAEEHFDEIADEYESEIPDHVRERLLLKKIRLMQRTLSEQGLGSQAVGLDLGCGQGWYLAEMRKLGYTVDGTDYSQGQLDKAVVNLEAQGVPDGRLVQADARALPFESNSFDFVYSINAIHHLLESDSQERALSEIVRVLRPGGIFMLHEINTENPVFRWYMGYLFPLIKKIDEGNEEWVLPSALPKSAGAEWAESSVEYFTFLPDFIPRRILLALSGLERALEESRFRRFSAHYQACLIKDGAGS